jgi:hypothetical protein
MNLKATLAKLPKPLLVVIAVVALLYVFIVFISTAHENETPSRKPNEFLVSVKRFFARSLQPDDLTQDSGACIANDASFQVGANQACAFTVPPSRRGSKMTLTLTQGSAARITVQKADPALATVETNFSAGSQESVDIFPGEATMVVQCLSFSQCTLAVS